MPRKGCRCAKCDTCFMTQSQILSHFQQVHFMNISPATFTFDSHTAFEAWKSSIQQSNNVTYAMHRGSRRNTNGSQTTYYVCTRGTTFSSLSTSTYCPSRITIRSSSGTADGELSVHYIPQHVHPPDDDSHAQQSAATITELRRTVQFMLSQLSERINQIQDEGALRSILERITQSNAIVSMSPVTSPALDNRWNGKRSWMELSRQQKF